MFGREPSEERRRRQEELMERWLQNTSVRLAEHLYSEGFLNYSVSIYPEHPVYASPAIVQRLVEEFFAGTMVHFGDSWLMHISFIMENGVARASFERKDSSYWCAEDYRPGT